MPDRGVGRNEDGFARFYRRALAGQEGSWFTRWLNRLVRPRGAPPAQPGRAPTAQVPVDAPAPDAEG